MSGEYATSNKNSSREYLLHLSTPVTQPNKPYSFLFALCDRFHRQKDCETYMQSPNGVHRDHKYWHHNFCFSYLLAFLPKPLFRVLGKLESHLDQCRFLVEQGLA